MWRFVFLFVITVPAFGQDADMTFSEAYAQYQSYVQAGNLDEALPSARLAYELGENAYGANHKNTAGLTYNYGTTLLETGHYDEAAEVLEIAYRRYEKAYGKNTLELIDPLMMQGHASAIPDQRPRLRFYDRAVRLAEAKGDLGLLAALNYDAGVRLTEQAKSLDGHKYLKKAYDIYTAQLGSDNTQTIGVAFFLGKVEMGRLNNDTAKKLFSQVIDGLPPEHRLALTSHGLLVQLYMQEGDAQGDRRALQGREPSAEMEADVWAERPSCARRGAKESHAGWPAADSFRPARTGETPAGTARDRWRFQGVPCVQIHRPAAGKWHYLSPSQR